MRKSSTPQFCISDMTSTPISPSNIMPTTDNVQMDIDSDSEAKKVAWELAQAQEWVRTTNEAWEKCWEERKIKEEEEEAQWIVAMEVAAREAEEILEREWQAQLQVSTRVLQKLTCINFVTQKDLEASVMMPEPLLAPFTNKGKR